MQYRYDEILKRMVYDTGIPNVDIVVASAVVNALLRTNEETREYVLSRVHIMASQLDTAKQSNDEVKETE